MRATIIVVDAELVIAVVIVIIIIVDVKATIGVVSFIAI